MSKLEHRQPSTHQSQTDEPNSSLSPPSSEQTFSHERRVAEIVSLPQSTVHLDIEKYQRMIDDPRLSKEDQEEIIRSIWALLMAMIDLGLALEAQ